MAADGKLEDQYANRIQNVHQGIRLYLGLSDSNVWNDKFNEHGYLIFGLSKSRIGLEHLQW